MKWLWRKIKRVFTPAKKPIGNYGSHGSSLPNFKPVWGLVLPHYQHDGGANNKKWYAAAGVAFFSEYTYAKKMFLKLISYKQDDRNNGDVSGAAERLVKQGCNSYLEPHKDAYNTSVGGFSFLYISGDALSKKYAEFFRDAYIKMFPNKNPRYSNGLKSVKKGVAGYNNLVKAKKQGMEVAILSETFFIDNKNDFVSPEAMAKFWKEVLV